MLPIKIVPFSNEHLGLDCDFLVNTGFRWKQFVEPDGFPENAVQGGMADDGTVLYIGRASIQNAVVPGYISGETEVLSMSYQGKEFQRDHGYEVLVVPDEFDEQDNYYDDTVSAPTTERSYNAPATSSNYLSKKNLRKFL